MPTMDEIKELVIAQGAAFDKFKSKYDTDLDKLSKIVADEMVARQRPSGRDSGGASAGDRKALDLAVRALFAGDQRGAYERFAEAKGMSAGADPDGGYLVVPALSDGMMTIRAEVSPLERLARTVEIDEGGSWEEPIDRDAAETAWVGEQQARSDTDHPELGELSVPLHEIYAMPKATQKLIDTARFDMLDYLRRKVGEALGLAESEAFHDGDGVARPRGFLGYTTSTSGDATRAWGQIQHIGTGASAAFPTSSTTVNPADVLVDVVSAMKSQYRAGARWLMNRATLGAVRKLKDAEGRHVVTDSLVEGAPSMLLGHPVDLSEQMPAISASSLSIAFANWERAYVIVRRPGIKFLVDPFTDKPNVRLYAYQRVGGAVSNFEAIKLLKFI